MPEPFDKDLDDPTWVCTFEHIQGLEECSCPPATGPRRVILNINDGHVDSLYCAVCGHRIPGLNMLDTNASGFSMTLTLCDNGRGEWWDLSDPGPYEYRAPERNRK